MVSRLLYLEPGQLRRAWPFFALYLALFAALTLADGLSLALFVARVGADALPRFQALSAVCVMLSVGWYLRTAPRQGGDRVFVGILVGPSVLGMVSVGAVEDLALIDSFALALIALLAGGELKVSQLRPQARNILYTTLAVTGVVWVGMTLIILSISPLVPFLAALSPSQVVAVSLILGIWAANSSPDLTVAVFGTVIQNPL